MAEYIDSRQFSSRQLILISAYKKSRNRGRIYDSWDQGPHIVALSHWLYSYSDSMPFSIFLWLTKPGTEKNIASTEASTAPKR